MSAYSFRTDLSVSFTLSIDADPHMAELALRYTVDRGRAATLEQSGEGPSVSIQSAKIITGHGTAWQREDDAPDWLWSIMEGDEALTAELLQHASDQDEYDRDCMADMRREERNIA